VWRLVRAEREVGTGPVRRLLVKEMTRRVVSRPSWKGMGPVTRPGKRMSWVNSVSWEREGEREPASPGEPERPVPRERAVTRREEEIREQVRPEKEEQGSGDVKSQVEKKVEPGMSVREALMVLSALRSTALIFRCCCCDREAKSRKMRRKKRDKVGLPISI
jgi:hypothetical protein